jgi:hypothetical protein
VNRSDALGAAADAVLLVLLGVAMVVVAATGDSLLYVRDVMTVPLVLAGCVVMLLGITGLLGLRRAEHRHTPRSFALVGIAIAFFLVVRPGPLSVEAGLTFDPATQTRVQRLFDIPREALVGADAPAGEVEARAVEVHGGQLWFAAQQIPDRLPEVALRMVGQFDPADGDPRLVRFRITCCAADALRLVTPIEGDLGSLSEGDWIEVFGQWDGSTTEPGLDVLSWRSIDTPDHPYLTLRDP